jgi:hypothetical protein
MAALKLAYNSMFTRMERISNGEDYSFDEVMAQALPITKKSRKDMSVWLAFWSRSLAEPRVASRQIEFHHRWHAQVKVELERHCERHSMPVPDDLEDICEGITAQINGLIIRGLVDASYWPQARLRKVLKAYLTQII